MAYAVVVERTVPISRQRFCDELMDFGGVAKLSPNAVDSGTGLYRQLIDGIVRVAGA